MRLSRAGWLIGVVLFIGLVAMAWWKYGDPFQTPGPTPRQGPPLKPLSTSDEMDAAHKTKLKAFPAKTAGVGGTPLSYAVDNGVKVFRLEAKVVQWEVEPGVRKTAWAYNGIVPGPEIRVKEGDRVRVIVKNSLPESTSVHWHGQMVENGQDGVPYLTQDSPIKPGQTYTYEFTARPFGTHMYHAHHDSTKQLGLGLLGPLIVEPKNPAVEPFHREYDKETTLIINDGPLGFTLNGKSFPATSPIVLKRGEKVRIRWINEGVLIHPMHLHGLAMKVVARDGRPLPQPYYVDTLTISPGERWDTIVSGENPGVWALHCHVLPHAEGETGMFGLVTAVIVK